MLKIVSKICLFLFLVAAPFLFCGFGARTLGIVSRISFRSGSRWLWFTIGAALFVPSLLAAKRFFPVAWCYLETLEHELTHLLIGLIFLKIPIGIRVSAHAGGEVRQIGFGTTGKTWVALAPYFLPTVSLVVLAAALLFEIKTDVLLAVLGWTTAFHLVTNWTETSFRQPDLREAGVVKSTIILPVMNLICYGSILAFVAGGQKGFGNFWLDSLSSSIEFAGQMFFGK